MKYDKKNLALMDDIMDAVTQLDEWMETQQKDPRITYADNRWCTAIEQAMALLPRELYDELCEAHSSEVAATGDAGILFGIHVADAIRDVASRPMDLSRHIQNRIRRKEALGA